jgi:nitrogen fixation NifU-like protein
MSADLRGLYQELLLDHSRRPRNFRLPDGYNSSAEGNNPLCGDRISLRVLVEDDRVRDIGFRGTGCAISTASASMMTEIVKGKSRADIESLFESFHGLLLGAKVDPKSLGKLSAFSGVTEFPVRVKCAALPWHTLKAALEGSRSEVTTE